MKQPFLNKVALVTGSGSGIGKATAKELAKAGAAVMLNGRNEEKLKQTVASMQAEGYRVAYTVADVTTTEGSQKLVQATLDTFGRLDVLVNNASASMRAAFIEMQPTYFREVLDSNIYGTVNPTLAALPHILKNRGSIVCISSLAGLYGLPSASAYSAGKMALTAFVQSLRAELKDTGIHLGIVYVGFTQNDHGKRVLNAQGELVPVAHRPGNFQQSQEQVAREIYALILHRKKKVVLSLMGKLMQWMVKWAPVIVDKVLAQSMKKMATMVE